MKKTLVLFLIACGIVFTSNIQAKNLDNINEVWQNSSSQSLVATQDISEDRDLNTQAPLPASGLIILIILIIVGLFFAKKHQNLAKKHQNLAKKV